MDDFIVDFCSCHRCMCFWVGCALEKKQRIIMNVNFSFKEGFTALLLSISKNQLYCVHSLMEKILVLYLSGKWFFKGLEYASLFKQSCDCEENNGINRPHDQIFQCPCGKNCQKSFSVQHIQP